MGNMDVYEGVFEEAILFGVWDGGPWTAFKLPNTVSMSWVGGGNHEYDQMVSFSKKNTNQW